MPVVLDLIFCCSTFKACLWKTAFAVFGSQPPGYYTVTPQNMPYLFLFLPMVVSRKYSLQTILNVAQYYFHKCSFVYIGELELVSSWYFLPGQMNTCPSGTMRALILPLSVSELIDLKLLPVSL